MQAVTKKILGEFNKKRYVLFLQDLDAAEEKHLKVLNEKLTDIINKFVFITNTIYYLNYKKAELIPVGKKDITNILFFELGFISKFINTDAFITFIKVTRYFKNIKVEVDPFEKQNRIITNTKKSEIKIIKKDIHIVNPRQKFKDIKLTKKDYQKIVENYKQHFKDKLDDFLNFIVYMRFTEDRKKSFLNLNAKSNWGKGFLMHILNDILEIGIKIVDEDLKEGRTTGLTEQQFLNSFVLFVDEFKKFKNYLFTVTHKFVIEPKFSFRFEVNLYAKILLNADKSESFNYLIDEQISNRVLLMEIEEAKELTKNELYLKNKLKYTYAVSLYIYNFITEKFKKLIKIGREAAALEADKELEKIYKKYSIQSNVKIEEIIKENLYAFLIKIKEEQDRLTVNEQKIASKIYIIEDTFYITTPVGVIIDILKNELDEEQFSKVKYKKGMLLQILNKEQKVYKINKLPKRAIAISLEEIEQYLGNIKIEKKEYSNIDEFLMKLRHYTYDIPPSSVRYLEEGVIEFYDVIDNLERINKELEKYNYDEEKFLKDYAERVEQAKKEYEIKKNFEEAMKTAEEEKELIGFLTAYELEKEYELLEKEESPF